MKDNIVYLKHILESIAKIEEYIKDFDYESFIADEKTVDSVVKKLEVIGEAANRVDKDFQSKYLDIPWDKIIGMRNRLIHDYLVINTKVVWETCQSDIKELKNFILKTFPDINS